jgi:hypothetical protein
MNTKRRETNKRKQKAQARALQLRQNIIAIILLSAIIMIAIVGFTFRSWAKESTSDTSFKYYKSIQVEKDDTLWGLAEQYNDTTHSTIKEYIAEIKKVNHLKSDKIISDEHLIIVYYDKDFK